MKKLRLAAWLGVFGGIGMIAMGVVEYRKAGRLRSEGVTVSGTLVSDDVLRTGKGRSSLSLIVDYTPEGQGQGYRKKFQVNQATFDEAKSTGVIPVVYLPENPRESEAGTELRANTEPLAIGGGVFAFGALVAWRLRRKDEG